MSKITLAAIAALLLAAVLCTAGCVEAPSDPIVGTYVTEDDISILYVVFDNNGTGCFVVSSDKPDASATGTVAFTWTKNADKSYTAACADGTTMTAVLNAEHGLLTIGDAVFQKYPSGLSGRATAQGMGDVRWGLRCRRRNQTYPP